MKNRRKKHFIDSAVQGALIRRIVLHWLIFFFLVFFTLPLWRLLRSTEFLSSFSMMMLESWAETAPVFVILIAILPLFVWDTVTLSNRFAGPVYRLHKTIKSVAAGEEVQPIRLRKGDFWGNLADDFNAMLQRLRSEQDRDTAAPDGDAAACSASAGRALAAAATRPNTNSG